MRYQKYISQNKTYSLTAYKQKAQDLIAQGKDILNLTIGDPVDETYLPVYKALKSFIDKNSQYPQNKGDLCYRQAVANWAKRQYDITLQADKNILSCNGTKEAIFHLPLLFDWSKKQEIFISDLSYPVYENSAQILNIPIRKLPVSQKTNFFPDLDLITKQQWQLCQIFWINSPHNPTTAIASQQYFRKLLQKAQQYNFLVCSDECYNDLFYTQKKPISALNFASSKHWLVFRSLSKRSHMTGFRIGAIISCNQQLISNYSRLRNPMGIGTPTFIQEAAIKAWDDDNHPKDFSHIYKKKRDLIKIALEKKGFLIFGSEATFYLWFSHPKLNSSQQIMQIFLKQLIFITAGIAFGNVGKGWCRLIFCISQADVNKLIKRINRLII